MTRQVLILAIVLLVISCRTKHRTKQWNLNQTVGWASENPKNYTTLFVMWTELNADSTQLIQKNNLDEAFLNDLKSKRLGDQAENDAPTETDVHFVVSKDYKNALVAILSVAKSFDVDQKVTVYQRDYTSFDKWADKFVYPK